MKKTFLTAFAALLMAIPAVQAQKVNKSGLLSKIEKSDADIADAKKNAKASTWINRGKALYEAAVEPTKSLFVNMDAAMLKLAVGEPSATKQVTLLNVPYEAWEYPYFIAYIKDGKVVTWTQTDWVLKEAPAMAIEAYNKAYEIDPKSAAKAKDGLQQISDFCSQVGNTGIDTAQKIRNTTDKEVNVLLSEANKNAEILIAEGEAEYMRILSEAYSDESKQDFYSFVRSLDALKASMTGDNKTVILSPDSPIAQIFYGR